jgi:outer membrane protein OmpA-like peptidoglycan-associated protein
MNDSKRLHGNSFKCCALILVLLTFLLSVCCAKTSTNANANDNSAPTNPAEQSTPAGSDSAGEDNAANREPSLVSLSSSAFPLKAPTGSYGRTVTELMDERLKSCWRSESGATAPFVFTLALPEKTQLKTVEFDCAYDLYNTEGACAKDISVEVSDASENDGYQKIADVSLKEGADNQKFPVTAEVAGRWLRLTIKSNHGSKDAFQLNDFRGYGTQLTHTPIPDISGTYESTLGDVHLKQEGTSLSGCYSYLGRTDNTLEGGIEGRLLKLSYCRYCGEANRIRGPAILALSPDGQRFIGLYWTEGSSLNDYGGEHWDGMRKSSEIGNCQGATGVQDRLTKDLEEFGRARVYGINFGSDSDHIKDESKPTLDKIVAVLKSKPDWKITIEGHTDATSTAQHNQELSERRAGSVKNYLTAAGIDGARLTIVGYGATKPVASNDNELGRAQNRRVELIKQ